MELHGCEIRSAGFYHDRGWSKHGVGKGFIRIGCNSRWFRELAICFQVGVKVLDAGVDHPLRSVSVHLVPRL